MPVKKYKPTTPGRRKSTVQVFSDITKQEPEKSLVTFLKSNAGRNNTGRLTVRHQGSGHKRLYRLVDFKQQQFDQEVEVKTIEYDPNRGARIMLVQHTNGNKAYWLAPQGIQVGDKLISSQKRIEPKLGNRLPLEYIPVGLFVHNLEMEAGNGGQMVRGAGTGAQLQVIEGDYAQLKMPSGEVRLIKKNCLASIGLVSNQDFRLIRYGKAGRRRHLGQRPVVKGKNMNPVDHPHGGGEGHSPIGLKGGPKTPWGKKALGVKTRQRGKWSDKFIVKRRRGKNN